MLTYRSRSPQIAAAARLLAVGWVLSLQFWILFDGATRSFAFAGIDLILAVAFFQMSYKRWFPAPLFFLHAALVIYHLYTAVIGPSSFWIQAFLNRTFEFELLYVIACAVYRIQLLKIRAAR